MYISTEASLPTTRLLQLLSSFKARFRDNLGSLDDLSTDNVLCITCGDLESQEHILNYQLPVVVEKHNVGLIVMDSVAANFRAEYEGRPKTKLEDPTGKNSGPAILAKRGKQLIKLGQTLRNLARDYKIVVAVANQVSDRFQTGPDSNNIDVMALDHQARWFTGWGEDEDMWDDLGTKKTPALGLVWANCIGARIALLKGYHRTKLGSNTEEGGADAGWRRGMKVVYAPWAEGSRYCEYVIDGDGVKGVEE